MVGDDRVTTPRPRSVGRRVSPETLSRLPAPPWWVYLVNVPVLAATGWSLTGESQWRWGVINLLVTIYAQRRVFRMVGPDHRAT